MTQYLISIYQPDGETPPPEVLEEVGRKLHVLNQEIKAAGAWVFSGGLHAPSTTTVLRTRAGRRMTDGPYVESKGIGGFWIVSAPDLDEALGWARKGGGSSRCRSRCGRSRAAEVLHQLGPGACFGDRARVPRGTARGGGASARLRRHRRRHPVADAFTAAVERWRATESHERPAGSSRLPGVRRSIGCGVRASRADRHAQAALHAQGEPVERARWRTSACG